MKHVSFDTFEVLVIHQPLSASQHITSIQTSIPIMKTKAYKTKCNERTHLAKGPA